MIEQQEMVNIEKTALVETVAGLRSSGWRLVQICPTTRADHFEMNYSFDKDRQFRNVRFAVRAGETVPSIGLIYANAFLYENEIHDLFGITIENMTIDYHGTLYQTRILAPFGLKEVNPAGDGGGAQGKEAKSVPAGTDQGKEHHGQD
jgi:ech hydrogenase subunit D